jgi:hypothetical protein
MSSGSARSRLSLCPSFEVGFVMQHGEMTEELSIRVEERHPHVADRTEWVEIWIAGVQFN